MATRSDVRAYLDSLLGSDPNLSDAEINVTLQLRYSHLYEKRGWSRRRRHFTISLAAQESSTSTTNVTVTLASATVTSAGTPWVSADDGKEIVIAGDLTPFFIDFVSTSQISLVDGDDDAVLWAAATNTSASWRMFQTIYALPTDAETVLSLTGAYEVPELDGGIEALDAMDPDRSSTGDHPTGWVYRGVTSAGARKIEVWPVPTQNRVLRGTYLRVAPTLVDTSVIDVSVPLLTYSAASDCCNMLFAKTGDESWKHLGVFYDRKTREVEDDAAFSDLKHLNPPASLGRARGGARQALRGTDFEVDHDLGLP